MKKLTFLLLALFFTALSTTAQVAINNDDLDPDPSAMLDVNGSNKGFLPPRVDTIGISNPAAGLMIYDTLSQCMRYYNGARWSDCMGGIAPASSSSFSCGNALVDSRDGQSYATVQIGTQCWMAENLNIGTMINGSNNQTANGTIEKYCYDDNTSNCDTYGGFYQWDEMMQYTTTAGTQGICPSGWHIPTDDEYKTLEMQLGMSSSEVNNTGWRGTDEGSKLAGNETLWTNGNLDQNANFGSSGFDALAAGFRNINGLFYNHAYDAHLWLSSENEDGTKGWNRLLRYNNSKVYRTVISKDSGFNVRCVRD